jgi:uncharacterized protein YuzE
MKLTYDTSVDAAMIYLEGGLESGSVDRTEVVDNDLGDSTMILDFDGFGRLIAIEILRASNILPLGLLGR